MDPTALISVPLWLGLAVGAMTVVLIVMSMATYRRLRSLDPTPLHARLAVLEAENTRSELTIRQELSRSRVEGAAAQRHARTEGAESMKQFSDTVLKQLGASATVQNERLDGFTKQLLRLTSANEDRMEQVRASVDSRLKELREDNGKRLEEMRRTVDEKLEATLDKRLGASFKLVSDRLEQVHKGLGEMQNLATGVGDLKRVLTNVKARGTWGEIQLERLLEQVLTPAQYEKNVATKPRSAERVEFCIKLPGPTDAVDDVVWLPIDSKFPQEDYQRILDAHDIGDGDGVAAATKQLEVRIRTSAKEISDKYLNPPRTTDFAILFLPTEGLYAEVVRRADLLEHLQRSHRVIIAGPTTLAALLNSLQMGFRTLAIEKRSSEVWQLLAAVKSEFGKFGTMLEKVQTKLKQASSVVEDAATKTRTIERKLTKVQVLPEASAAESLPESSLDEEDAEPTELTS